MNAVTVIALDNVTFRTEEPVENWDYYFSVALEIDQELSRIRPRAQTALTEFVTFGSTEMHIKPEPPLPRAKP